MPPPDQPERPKPTMPAAAREAMLAREAAAKAKAAAGAAKPAAVRAAAPPPPPVVPARPKIEVGLAGFVVWILAAVVAAVAVYLDYRGVVKKNYRVLINPRTIVEAVLAGILLLSIWFTQALERDSRLVKLVWAIAILTIIGVPALRFVLPPK